VAKIKTFELVDLLFHVALKHFSSLDSLIGEGYDLEIFIGHREDCSRIYKDGGNICHAKV
jgi:hypothetical protein